MTATQNALSAEEIEALKTAFRLHGRATKSVVRAAWCEGTYSRFGLAGHDGTLQRMRNRVGGRKALEKLTLKSLA